MDIEKILRSYEKNKKRIPQIHKEINDMIESEKYGAILKGQVLNDMPHGSGVGEPVFQAVQNCLDHIDKIYQSLDVHLENLRNDYDRAIREVAQVESWLILLSPLQAKVITLRYIEKEGVGLEWLSIADILDKTDRWAQELRDTALQKIRNHIEKAGH